MTVQQLVYNQSFIQIKLLMISKVALSIDLRQAIQAARDRWRREKQAQVLVIANAASDCGYMSLYQTSQLTHGANIIFYTLVNQSLPTTAPM